MKILRMKIDKYGPLSDIDLKLNTGFQCIYGPNESGKTLIIDALLKTSLGKKQPKRYRDLLNRVEEDPIGWILVNDGTANHTLDDSKLMTDILSVTGDELRDIFIIRNSDLAFLDEKRCLGRLTDRILNLSSKDIELIQEEIRTRGRVTKTGKLSSAGALGNPLDQFENARSLISSFDTYLEEINEEEIEVAEQRIISLELEKEKVTMEIAELGFASKYQTLVAITGAVNALTKIIADEELLGKDTQKTIKVVMEEYSDQRLVLPVKEREGRTFAVLSVVGGVGLVLSVLLSMILEEGVFGVLQSGIAAVFTVFVSIVYLSRMRSVSAARRTGKTLLDYAKQYTPTCETVEDAHNVLEKQLRRAENLDAERTRNTTILQERLGTRENVISSILAEAETRAFELTDELGDRGTGGYDETTLDLAKERLKELEDDIASSSRTLKDHRSKLQDFQSHALRIRFETFLDYPVEIVPDSLESLRKLKDKITEFVNCIETKKRIANDALTVFDRLLEEEEEKVSELLTEGSRTSQVFQEISKGSYTKVEYLPGDKRIMVVDRDGVRFPPEKLSKATKDQLYLSIRVAVGEKLLEGKQGFFIMDDPFLASDLERAEIQYEIIRNLVDNGWQIVFFTAKKNIAESLSKMFETNLIKLDPLRPT